MRSGPHFFKIGDKFGESLGGSQAPPSLWEAPGLARKFPKPPGSFSATSPEVLSLWNRTAIQGLPGSFPDFPGSSPDFPGSFPDFPGGQRLSLGSLTPSPDSQKLSLTLPALPSFSVSFSHARRRGSKGPARPRHSSESAGKLLVGASPTHTYSEKDPLG